MGSDRFLSDSRYDGNDDSFVETHRGSSSGFNYSEAADRATRGDKVSPELLPLQNGQCRDVDCFHETAVAIMVDSTGTVGDAIKLILDQLRNFFKRCKKHDYAKDVALLLGLVGDAKDGDKAPFQITTNFSQSREIYSFIEKFFIERGGGGGGMESYEMIGWYMLMHCVLTNCKLPCLFIVGDEKFYPELDPALVQKHFGDIIDPISSKEVFERLMQKFNNNVFFIYVRQDEATRKTNIDAEITKRLQEAGAKSGDIRVSLMWNNRNDLDLHFICPCGSHIFFSDKKCRTCGGHLDVDRNVRGETTKPVENIYFPTDKTPMGRYQCWVRNYAYHGWQRGDNRDEDYEHVTKFLVEVEINGKIEHYEKEIQEVGERSDVLICDFNYAGKENAQADGRAIEGPSVYEVNYNTETILDTWRDVLGPKVLVLDDPNSIMDLILGAMAMANGGRDLEQFLTDITDGPGRKEINAKRAKVLRKALRPFEESLALEKISVTGILPSPPEPTSTGPIVKKSKRR